MNFHAISKGFPIAKSLCAKLALEPFVFQMHTIHVLTEKKEKKEKKALPHSPQTRDLVRGIVGYMCSLRSRRFLGLRVAHGHSSQNGFDLTCSPCDSIPFRYAVFPAQETPHVWHKVRFVYSSLRNKLCWQLLRQALSVFSQCQLECVDWTSHNWHWCHTSGICIVVNILKHRNCSKCSCNFWLHYTVIFSSSVW